MKLPDLLREYNVPYVEEGQHHHVTSGFLGLDCPHCSPQWEHFRLGYNLEKGYFTCWHCGYLKLAHVLPEILGIPWGKILTLLDPFEKDYREEEEKPKGKLLIPKGVGELDLPHQDYLLRRGFHRPMSSGLVDQWKIQGIGLASQLAWRLFIPVFLRGEMVSWTTRSVSDFAGKRYVNAPNNCSKIPIKSLLYGEDFCRHAVIVCEGPIDCWKIGPGAVCTFGVNVSAEQVKRISKYPVRYICLDNEPQAQERANRLCHELSIYPGKTVNLVLDGKDPGSASDRELNRLRKLLR